MRHPSRAIVLQADPEATGDALDAWMGTHCRDGENGHGPICFEQLALDVRGEAARHLDGIVAPLVIHDLPTDVWWPGAPPFDDPIFDQLLEIGDRLVVNSTDFIDLSEGLRRLTGIRRRSGVGDLAWERLCPWQELPRSSSTRRGSAATCPTCRAWPSGMRSRPTAAPGRLPRGGRRPVRGLDRNPIGLEAARPRDATAAGGRRWASRAATRWSTWPWSRCPRPSSRPESCSRSASAPTARRGPPSSSSTARRPRPSSSPTRTG